MVEFGMIYIITCCYYCFLCGITQRGTSGGSSKYNGLWDHKYNSRVVYDPKYPEIDHIVFKNCDWTEFCLGVKDTIPIHASEHKEKEVNICMLVDSYDE